MRNHQKRNNPHPCGLSAIETLLGAIILAVSALAITVAFNPMNEWERSKTDQRNLNELNALAKIFTLDHGTPPDRYLTELNTHGLTKSRLLMTPYGGYYQFETTLQAVINPQAPTAR